MITKCKSCNADIMFVTTPSGKSHPLNLPAVKMFVKDQDGHIYSMTDCYTSHFANCPDAGGFRKPVISRTATFFRLKAQAETSGIIHKHGEKWVKHD